MDEPGRVPSLASVIQGWTARLALFIRSNFGRSFSLAGSVEVLHPALQLGERMPELVLRSMGPLVAELPDGSVELWRSSDRACHLSAAEVAAIRALPLSAKG